MGKSLAQWFVYLVGVGIFAGYAAGIAPAPEAEYPAVFRYVGTVAFASYALALPQVSIWYHRNWGTTLKTMIDGLVSASGTGGVFGWLWPS